ncbi:unnamed protein product [Lepidochelys kempii]
MVGVFLLWVFVGGCSPLSLAVPAGPVAALPGGPALLPRRPAAPGPAAPCLPGALAFPAHGPPGAAAGGPGLRRGGPLAPVLPPGPWERGRGYEGRAGLGPREASLLLRGRPARGRRHLPRQPAGPGRAGRGRGQPDPAPAPAADPSLPTDPTTVLPPTSPAPASSTELQGDTAPPLAPVWATLDGGRAVMPNAVRLCLAGLVLCLLVLIVGEYVLSMRNKDTSGTGSPTDAAATVTTLSTIYVLQEMPIPDGSEELYASLSF